MFIPVICLAQAEKVMRLNVGCASGQSMMAVLMEYDELPMLEMITGRGEEIRNRSVLFVNSKTGTYSLLEQIEKDLWCVISTGNKLEAYNK